MGAGSDRTRCSATAASIWATSVDPQRDMWKMKPAGGSPG